MGPFLTYMHAATASVSAVDLSNFSPIIFLDLQWKVHDDLCRSDYYYWTLRNANWTTWLEMTET